MPEQYNQIKRPGKNLKPLYLLFFIFKFQKEGNRHFLKLGFRITSCFFPKNTSNFYFWATRFTFLSGEILMFKFELLLILENVSSETYKKTSSLIKSIHSLFHLKSKNWYLYDFKVRITNVYRYMYNNVYDTFLVFTLFSGLKVI